MRLYAARKEIEILITSLLDEWLVGYTIQWLEDPVRRPSPILVLRLETPIAYPQYFTASLERVVGRVTHEVLVPGITANFENGQLLVCL